MMGKTVLGIFLPIWVRDGVLAAFEFGEFVLAPLAPSSGGDFVEGFCEDEMIH